MTKSLFIQEQLNRVTGKVLAAEFPEYLMASGSMVDITAPLGAGVETYSFETMTKVGSAAILANGSEDIPMVNAHMERHYGQLYTLANGYNYTVQDMERAQYAGVPLNAQLAMAAREIMEAEWDEIGYFGKAPYNILGFIDYPNVPSEAAANDGNSNGGSNSTEWRHKTPVQIYRDLRQPASKMRVATKGKYFPAVYALPQEQYDLIAETPYPDNQGNETILSFFLKTQSRSATGVQSVVPVPRLEGAFSGGVDGLIAFTKRADRQEIYLGMDFEQRPPQLHNLNYEIICRMRVGGAVVYRPMSLRQLTGI